jgi:hypothetical protein
MTNKSIRISTRAILSLVLTAALGACSSDNSEPASTAGSTNNSSNNGSNNSGGNGSGGSNSGNGNAGQSSSSNGIVTSELAPDGFIVGQACYIDADKRCFQNSHGPDTTEEQLADLDMVAAQSCAVQDSEQSDECPTDGLIGCCTPEPVTSLVDDITSANIQCHYEGTTNTNAQTQCEMGGGTWTGEDLGGGNSGGSGGAGGGSGGAGGGSSAQQDWVGLGECRAITSQASCAEYPDKPYSYRCVLAAMEVTAPEAGCEHPTSGTLPDAAWCCPSPLCIRGADTDYVCSGETPYNYSCPTDELVPEGCTVSSPGSYCCPE